MILFSEVTKRYEAAGAPVLDHFTEKIDDGEFAVFTGRSGVGKTTALRLILREIEPTEGTVFVDRQDIGRIPRHQIPLYRRRIGVIFQDFRLMQEATVYDNLSITGRILGKSAKETESRIMHVLSFLGIDHYHKRYPAELSGGEQQKVCLARAIMNDPKFLLADEPTGNLDPAASRELLRLLELIHRQGKTVILATHDINLLNEETLSCRQIAFPETEGQEA
ncbi:MAG: ATP-binding cassette domain-containing protein [Lachnospiraceae bacterium]|nr:ATP-binding cassette domain-containing protein [Lachnospiraceae bacterium]